MESLFIHKIGKKGLPDYVLTSGRYINKLLWVEKDGLYDFDGNFMVNLNNIDDKSIREFNLLEHYNL